MNDELIESGIPWIGDIPSGWKVKRIKDIASLQSGDNITSESISENGDYPVYGGNGLRGYFDKYTHDGYYALIGRQGALCGNINYAKGKFWASEHAVVVSILDGSSTRWLGEVMRAMNLNQYSQSAAQPGLAVENIKRLKLPYPPKPEQEAIAQHLDTVTAQIDEAIAIKQQQVEKLENYWKTRLHEAVTKGLSEATAMKPGNDSYLGAVPTHWKVDRIKDIAEFNPWKPKISGDEIVSLIPMDCVSEDGKIGEVNSTTFEDVDKGLNYFEAGDVIFAKITPCMENGKGAFVKSLPTQYAFGSTEFFVFRPHGSILGSYLYYATRAEPFRQYAELNMKGAAGQQRVPSKFLATCEIAFPVDKQEQQAIVTYLDDLHEKVIGVQQRLTQQIATLQAYRRSVIHEYVTGKKRVVMEPISI